MRRADWRWSAPLGDGVHLLRRHAAAFARVPTLEDTLGATLAAFRYRLNIRPQPTPELSSAANATDTRCAPGRWLRAALAAVFLAVAGLCVAYLWLSVLPRLWGLPRTLGAATG